MTGDTVLKGELTRTSEYYTSQQLLVRLARSYCCMNRLIELAAFWLGD